MNVERAALPRRTWLASLLGVAPMAADLTYKALIHPRPFWVVFYDPETIYMYDAFRMVSGQPPLNADNPGAPVQLFTALIALFTDRSPFAIDAIRYSGYVIALLATIGAMWLLSATVFRNAGPWLTVAGLWTYWIAPKALAYDAVWSPEIFYFAFGALVLAALTRVDRPWLVGLALGLCIATKFTFLAWGPAVVLALLVERHGRVRKAAIAIGATAIGFLVATLAQIPRYPKMFVWLWKLTTRSGQYGSGPHEAPSIGHAVAAYVSLAATAKASLLWILAVVVLLVVARRRNMTLIVFGVVSAICTVVLAIRTPDFHYLLPMGLSIVALVAAAKDAPRKAAIAACVFCGLVLTKTVVDDIRTHDMMIAECRRIQQEVAAVVANSGIHDPVVVYGWRMPQPSFALRTIAFDSPGALAALGTRYPREGHYDDSLHRIYLPPGASHWDLLVIDPQFLKDVPGGVGPVVGEVPPFIIVRAAGRG